MKWLKKHKQDILVLLLYSLIYIIIVGILTRGEFVFASTTDFEMQHYIFPEYFRNLFYDTKDLFPDFALNIGGGQNIYNFSYYGLLSPIILLSYFLPMIPMIYYLIGASFIIVVSSTFLFYKFLSSHHFKTSTCIMVSLLFLFATPILYHAKRHIMFINYFPFLILGFFGIDHFISKKRILLLTISITFMIFTSFYYSVSGIIVLIIYGIYEFLKNHSPKELVKFLSRLAIPFLLAVLISAILWLPTAYTLLAGRGEAIKEIEKWLLLTPNLKVLYSSYGPGITLLEFILLGLLVFDKDQRKHTKYLALFLLIIFLIPLFNFILNGTLYINTKSLIPFLPLELLLIAICYETLLKNYKKLKIYLVISTCLITVAASATDMLIPKEKVNSKEDKDYQKLVEEITKEDQSFYRIGNETYTSSALNRVYSMDEYKSSVYSSTQNKYYQTWVQREQKNNEIYRNNMMLTLSGGVLSQSMMGEKHIISKTPLKDGYQLIDKKGELLLYENELALPIIYATKDSLSKEEYQNLEYPKNVIAAYTKNIPEDDIFEKVELEIKDMENIEITKEEDVVKIRAGANAKMTVVPEEDLTDKVLFVTFKNKFNRGCHHEKNDQTIKINHISNKLTCRTWKYHNNNYVFHYILLSPEELEITFSEAYYKLGEIEVVAIPKSILEERQEEITPVKIKKEGIKGDTITGEIEVTEKQNLEIAIPYDEGFTILVDGKKQDYQKSLQNGMTLEIEKGKHKIEITYEAPWKNIATIISIFGIVLLLGICIWDYKNVKKVYK